MFDLTLLLPSRRIARREDQESSSRFSLPHGRLLPQMSRVLAPAGANPTLGG